MKRKRLLTILALVLLLLVFAFPVLSVYYDGYFTNLLVKGQIDIPEVTAPGSPGSNVGRLYVADDSGTTTLYFKDSAGTAANLNGKPERGFNLPLVAAFIDGTGVMGNDGTTAPGMAETDSIPAIVYASSAETTKIQWTFRVPADYSTGLGFRILMSSDGASAASQSIDWALWINADDTTFDAASIEQTAVAGTSATLDVSNELITLAVDATGEAAISAGVFVTVDIWNAGTSSNTTEIKGVQAYYTATK